MASKKPNMDRDALLYRSIVPKGYRPRTDEQIERMLQTTTPVPMDDSKASRMLRKAKGEIETFHDESSAQREEQTITVDEQAFAALCRSKGKPLPPELEAKIKAMEARARKNPDESSG